MTSRSFRSSIAVQFLYTYVSFLYKKKRKKYIYIYIYICMVTNRKLNLKTI